MSAVILQLIPAQSFTHDSREDLPNYPDKRRAHEIFADWAKSHRRTSFAPFLDWKLKSYRGRTAIVNALGYRMTPRTKRTPRGRIVRFFGGSTVWGAGVD